MPQINMPQQQQRNPLQTLGSLANLLSTVYGIKVNMKNLEHAMAQEGRAVAGEEFKEDVTRPLARKESGFRERVGEATAEKAELELDTYKVAVEEGKVNRLELKEFGKELSDTQRKQWQDILTTKADLDSFFSKMSNSLTLENIGGLRAQIPVLSVKLIRASGDPRPSDIDRAAMERALGGVLDKIASSVEQKLGSNVIAQTLEGRKKEFKRMVVEGEKAFRTSLGKSAKRLGPEKKRGSAPPVNRQEKSEASSEDLSKSFLDMEI